MPDKKLSPDEIGRNQAPLQHVRSWLRLRKKSQKTLAHDMGVSEPTVSKWLSGAQGMSVAQLFELAKLLDCQPAGLLSSPDEAQRAARLRRLMELASGLDDAGLETLIAVAEQISPRPPPDR